MAAPASAPLSSPSRSPRLIVTRPEPEATRWVQALQAQGQGALAWPLIVIEPEAITEASRPAPGDQAALMFVSGAAVRAFFAQLPVTGWVQADTRFWCTGPGTAAALREAGVPASAIDSPPEAAQQFDSEALWAQVQTQVQPGKRVCIVRGGDAWGQPAGRDWLARTLTDAGAQVDTVLAYRRLPPHADAAWRAGVQEAVAARDVWLFSSSEAVAHLREALAGESAPDWGACRALATHARIADAARQLGFGQVQTVAPLLPSVLAALRHA